jgi:hypothetical protein
MGGASPRPTILPKIPSFFFNTYLFSSTKQNYFFFPSNCFHTTMCYAFDSSALLESEIEIHQVLLNSEINRRS